MTKARIKDLSVREGLACYDVHISYSQPVLHLQRKLHIYIYNKDARCPWNNSIGLKKVGINVS